MVLKKTLFFTFTALILCPILSSADSRKPTLNISFVLPLSGEWTFLGEGIVKAAQLAKFDLRAEQLTLSFENNSGSLSESALIANRLVAEGQTDAVISIISGVAQVIKPIAAKNKVIHIGICSDTTVADARYNFINYMTAKEGVEKYIDYFEGKYGKNASLGIYSLNEAGFKRITEEVQRKVDKSSLEIKFLETYNQGEHDFKPLLLRGLVKKPKVILLLGLSPELETLAMQLQRYNRQIPLTSIESFGLLKDSQVFKGSWYVDAGQASSSFIHNYETWSKTKITAGVVHAYDTVSILYKVFASLVKDGHISNDREVFRGNLATKIREIRAFKGESGDIALDENGVFYSGAIVRVVE